MDFIQDGTVGILPEKATGIREGKFTLIEIFKCGVGVSVIRWRTSVVLPDWRGPVMATIGYRWASWRGAWSAFRSTYIV